jgi:hypothetical protein
MKTQNPTVDFESKVNEYQEYDFQYTSSGNVTSSVSGGLVGMAKGTSRIKKVLFGASQKGRDDVDTLKLELDLKVNGSSILSTKPTIEGNSGEASAATYNSDAVISGEGNLSEGDRLTLDLDLTRTTPDTEMSDVFVAVVCGKRNYKVSF